MNRDQNQEILTMLQDIITIKYSSAEIKKQREHIGMLLMDRSSSISSTDLGKISVADLKMLYELYEQIFFKGWIKQHWKGKLQFAISRQMTKTAGKTVCFKKSADNCDLALEVRISLPIIANYGTIEGHDLVGGIKSGSRLEALQLIFEHELVHVVEFICFGSSNCKGKRFQALAENLFGHHNNYHQLPTNNEIVRHRLGLAPGVWVEFDYQGAVLKGIISHIRKRAGVMVEDKNGAYQDRQGKRYSKYLVPLQLLRTLNNLQK